MTNRELLEQYRDLQIEQHGWEMLADHAMSNGAPKPLTGVQLTGMPHGTNDPQSAAGQHYDRFVHDCLENSAKIADLLDKFVAIVDSIQLPKDRAIIQRYYGLGWTDERTAHDVDMSREAVNLRRREILATLDGEG